MTPGKPRYSFRHAVLSCYISDGTTPKGSMIFKHGRKSSWRQFGFFVPGRGIDR